MASGGVLLGQHGWGYGVSIVTSLTRTGQSPGATAGRAATATAWFNDPHRGIVAIAMTQVSDFLWNGGSRRVRQASRKSLS